MAFDSEGNYLNINGYVRVGDIKIDQQVMIGTDPIRVQSRMTEGAATVIEGVSVARERYVIFFLDTESEVPTWTR